MRNRTNHVGAFVLPAIAVMSHVLWPSAARCMCWPVDVAPELTTSYGEYQNFTKWPYYLHDGLDVCGPADSLVGAISKGVVVYVRYMNEAITKHGIEDITPEEDVANWVGASDEWAVLADVDAGNQPQETGWVYAHISKAWMRSLRGRGKSLYGWIVDPGVPFTRVASQSSCPPHVHVSRQSIQYAPDWEWGYAIANPLELFADAGIVTSDIVTPYIPPAYDGVSLDFDESSSCYPASVLPRHSIADPLPDWPLSEAQIAFGKVDIAARVDDSYGQGYTAGDIHTLGIFSIGYEILTGWPGTSAVVDAQTRSFTGTIPKMDDDDLTQAIYRVTPHFATDNEHAFYSVTNYHDQMIHIDNWSAEAQAACWNTRMEQDGGLPWEAADAGYPDEAEFSDGLYTVTVTASDYFNTTSNSVPVIVDNWAPWLKEVVVWKDSEGGEPDVPDSTDWTIYHGKWERDPVAGANVLQVLHQEGEPGCGGIDQADVQRSGGQRGGMGIGAELG